MSQSTLLDQAGDFFERNDFESARKYFREAFLIEEPSNHDISELWAANIYSQQIFLENLTALYSHSFDLKITFLRFLTKHGSKHNAMVLLTNMLDHDSLTTDQEIQVRLLRFTATCEKVLPNKEYFIRDFQKLWNPDFIVSYTFAYQKMVVRIITKGFQDPKIIPILNEILAETKFPEEIEALLQLKIAELTQLEKIIKSLSD